MTAPSHSSTRAPSPCYQDPQPQEQDTPCEAFRQRFRQFQYEEADGPREAFCTLWELGSQWLKPQTRSMEKILALLVLEQFLHILPTDAETRMYMLSPETRQRLFTLIEGLLRDDERPGERINMSDILLEELVSMGILLTPSNTRVTPPVPQLTEPAQELHEFLLEEPLEMNYYGHEKYQDLFNVDYKHLEPPGIEPPEQLLANYKDPQKEENSCLEEMPGSSAEAQTLIDEACQPAGPTEKPGPRAQLGLCSAHLKSLTRKVVKNGPRGGTGSFRGSLINGHLFVSQEENTHDNAMGNNPFTDEASFSVTQANYIDEERQQCTLCKREFMFKLGLRENVNPFTNSKSHQCALCGKMFKGKSHLDSHKVIHTRRRPFVCEYCQKSYKHKSSLQRHLKIHPSQAS
ncbi:zinc finger protein 449-like [Meriones unguiculatus]|uniref:zinc finger protein 449-like n=1 Tax=Meriones unguiculatus TaxID=10047 RepID=UPI00293E8E03|nr:zinc finger protein 449-like [Meriones unguiculatus]